LGRAFYSKPMNAVADKPNLASGEILVKRRIKFAAQDV
jgi:hypothetical protein